jgi:hypothetical protein
MSPQHDGTPVPAFQPDLFFLSRTEGRGLVRDLTGRLIDGCSITTLGVWDHDYGALRFDETFVYDSGLRDVLNWTFAPDAQGRMSASEANITAPVRGWAAGADYHLRFKRRGGPRAERLTLTYNVRFTLMQPDLALKVVRLSLFGLTLGEMIAFHRRID